MAHSNCYSAPILSPALYAPVEARRGRPRRLKLPGILNSGTATDACSCLPCTIGYSNTPKCRFTATPL